MMNDGPERSALRITHYPEIEWDEELDVPTGRTLYSSFFELKVGRGTYVRACIHAQETPDSNPPREPVWFVEWRGRTGDRPGRGNWHYLLKPSVRSGMPRSVNFGMTFTEARAFADRAEAVLQEALPHIPANTAAEAALVILRPYANKLTDTLMIGAT